MDSFQMCDRKSAIADTGRSSDLSYFTLTATAGAATAAACNCSVHASELMETARKQCESRAHGIVCATILVPARCGCRLQFGSTVPLYPLSTIAAESDAVRIEFAATPLSRATAATAATAAVATIPMACRFGELLFACATLPAAAAAVAEPEPVAPIAAAPLPTAVAAAAARPFEFGDGTVPTGASFSLESFAPKKPAAKPAPKLDTKSDAAADAMTRRAIAETKAALQSYDHALESLNSAVKHSILLTAFISQSAAHSATAVQSYIDDELPTLPVRPLAVIVTDRSSAANAAAAVVHLQALTVDAGFSEVLFPIARTRALPLAKNSSLAASEEYALVSEIFCSTLMAVRTASATAVLGSNAISSLAESLCGAIHSRSLDARMRFASTLVSLKLYVRPSAFDAKSAETELRAAFDAAFRKVFATAKLEGGTEPPAITFVPAIDVRPAPAYGDAPSAAGDSSSFVLAAHAVWYDRAKLLTDAWIQNMSSHLWFRSLGFGDAAREKEKWRNFRMQMIDNSDDASTFLRTEFDLKPTSAAAKH